MMKNWKYSAKSKEGEIVKGTFPDTEQSASQICFLLELNGYEVLSLSCVEELPKWMAIFPPLKRRYSYA